MGNKLTGSDCGAMLGLCNHCTESNLELPPKYQSMYLFICFTIAYVCFWYFEEKVCNATSKRMHGMNQTEAASFIISDI